MSNDVIIGAWRNGLTENSRSYVEQMEAKRLSGFRMFPAEEAVLELTELLSGYDEFAEEVLTQWRQESPSPYTALPEEIYAKEPTKKAK